MDRRRHKVGEALMFVERHDVVWVPSVFEDGGGIVGGFAKSGGGETDGQ